jgi:hypothetical protein
MAAFIIMSTIKNNFIQRNNNKNTNSFFDAGKYIDEILANDKYAYIIPNSSLYNLAVKQYNTNIENTLIRPSVPSWFCGKINPATGELISTLTDEELRVIGGVSPTNANTQPPLSSLINLWPVDECLSTGLPGSTGYSTCESVDEIIDSTTDYNSSVDSYPHEPIFIKGDKRHFDDVVGDIISGNWW